MTILRDFWFFWILFGAAVVFVTFALRPRSPFWHLRLNRTEVMVATPWGMLWLADVAFDACDYRWCSGVRIYRRIPGSRPGEQIYRAAYRYEAPIQDEEREANRRYLR